MNGGEIALSTNYTSRILILTLLYFLFFLPMHSQTIQVTNVTPNPVCGSQPLEITFTATNGNGNPRYFSASTVFTAYLSSVGGVAPYTSIGTLTLAPYGFAPGNGVVNAGVKGTVTIPSNAVGIYKIAVGASQPNFNAGNGAGASLSFVVNASPIGGSVSGGTTVCPDINSTVLTLTGQSGFIEKWQSSTVSDFSSNVVDIANTTASHTATNISVTTYFRAVANDGICPGYSSSTTVQVASGNPSPNQNICFNLIPANIQLTSYQGTAIQWQSSNDNLNFFDIPGAVSGTLSGAQMGNLIETMYYRAIITGGSCGPMISGTVTVVVSTSTVGGSLSPSSVIPAICPSDTVVLTLSGHTGNVIKWQSSTQQNFNNNVIDIFNYTTTLTVTNLNRTTYFRAVVDNGGCAGALSTKATVNVINGLPVGGTVAPSSTTYCNAVNTTTLTLSGYNGSVAKWQSSMVSNFSAGVVDIANTTNILTVVNAASTTYYRASVTRNSCTTNSSVAVITVNPPLTATITTNNGPICSANNAVFTLAGSVGATVQYKINGGPTQMVVLTGGSATVTIAGVVSDQIMTLVAVTFGTCSQALSASSTVAVNPAPSCTITGNNGPVCSGNDVVFSLSGTIGAFVIYSVNGGGNQLLVLTGLNDTIIISGATSNQTLQLLSISLGACSQLVNQSSTVNLDALSIWTGGVDNQWSTPGNWSCNSVPNLTSNTIINSGNVVVAIPNAVSNSIQVNGTSTLIVNSGNNITVTNAVSVAGSALMELQNNANLIQINNVSNTGNIAVNRQSSSLMRLDYTLWSSPVTNQNLLNFSPQTVAIRFYEYDSATNGYSSVVPGSTAFQLGKGYLIRMPDNWPVSTPTKWNGVFTGVPHNGSMNISLFNGGAGFRYNAVGNPYPSPINLFTFVNANSGNITGTLYFWRKRNSTATDPGYCTWTTAGFVNNGEAQAFDPNGVLRTGQGFFVEALGPATSLSFTNTMRIADNANQFFRNSSDEIVHSLGGDRLWLNIVNDSGANNQMLIGYFESATLGLDNGIDGIVMEDSPLSLSMVIDGMMCLIQGKPSFVITDTVPLRLKTTYNGNHTISIDHYDGLFSGTQNIYLKDKLLNVMHDLKQAAYTFTVNEGSYDNRFEIMYENQTLHVPTNNFNAEDIIVYKDENNALAIKTNNVVLDKVEVYDIEGRLLAAQNKVGKGQTTLSRSITARQVLMVKLQAIDGTLAYKKITF